MEQTERYPGRGENQYDESFKETGGSDEFEGSSGILDDEFADECIRELARQQQEEENRRARRERQEQKEALEGIRDSINQSNRDAQRRFEYEKWRDLKQDIDRWNRR